MENKSNHRGSGGAPPPSSSNNSTTTVSPSTKPPASDSSTLGPRRRASGAKRKSNNSNSSSSKRSRRTSTPLPHLNHTHNGPVTRARQSPHKAAAAAAAATTSSLSASFGGASTGGGVHDKPAEPLLQPTPPPIGEVGTDSRDLVSKQDDLTLEPDIDAEFEAVRSRDPNVHVIPTSSAWFSWTKIHPIEERALPLFFNGKSENRTSEIYMEMRNIIMLKFHKDPKVILEAKDIVELTIGELDARLEVFAFLEHWGLINFHPFPVVDSDKEKIKSDQLTKSAFLLDNLYKFEVVTSRPLEDPKADVSKQVTPQRLFPEAAIAEEVRPEGPSVEYHCNSCSADCSRKRYHCQKQADFDLCSECYNSGKFDSGMSPADFILMEPAEVPGVSGGSWTDQETLLLLEALELFGENWSEIAEHVATKSKAQCILHFVQMPIEDTFLEGKDDFDATLQGSNGADPVCDDSTALKESKEAIVVKSTSHTDLSVLKEPQETKETNICNNDPPLDASPETRDSRSTVEEKPLSPKVEASDPLITDEIKLDQEISVNGALNALKEAFQAVGSGESISFADAGNPVMALAIFLSGLVAPDSVAASAQSSLKAMLEESPGVHLVSRHCFILGDTPQDLKDPPACESVDTEMLDCEAQKDDDKALKDEPQKENSQVQDYVLVEVQKVTEQKEGDVQVQNHLAALDGIDASKECAGKEMSKECADKEMEDAVTEETVLQDGGKGNSATQELDDVVDKDDIAPGSMNELNNSALSGNDGLSNPDVDKDVCISKESNDVTDMEADVTNEEAALPSATKESDELAFPGKGLPIDASGLDDSAIPAETVPKESAVVSPVGEISQSSEDQKDVDMDSCLATLEGKDPKQTAAPTLVPSENEDPPQETVVPTLVGENNDPQEAVAPTTAPSEDKDPEEIIASTSVPSENEDTQETVIPPSALSENKDTSVHSENKDPPKEVAPTENKGPEDKVQPALITSESQDSQGTVAPTKAFETGSNTGDCGVKTVECESEKTGVLSKTRDDDNVDKLKRAALTALSAAAVKSKLLADQEEEEIRKLATFLIEKQLHKIETKLSFFGEMETAITRAKDQMDKSRQRLYQERGQIIAARLGMSATASRVMPPSSLPSNRVAMSFANSMPKSLQHMNFQKTSVPSPSFSSASGAAPGPGGSTRTSR
ncbi:hypothetical protein ACHQM5_017068 [Ranunculus cassubicifolius]